MTDLEKKCRAILRRIWKASRQGKGVRLTHDEIEIMLIGPWADPAPDENFVFEFEHQGELFSGREED